jgi:hypothetical protein
MLETTRPPKYERCAPAGACAVRKLASSAADWRFLICTGRPEAAGEGAGDSDWVSALEDFEATSVDDALHPPINSAAKPKIARKLDKNLRLQELLPFSMFTSSPFPTAFCAAFCAKKCFPLFAARIPQSRSTFGRTPMLAGEPMPPRMSRR